MDLTYTGDRSEMQYMATHCHAKSQVNEMVDSLERLIYDLCKNSSQMDLVNTSIEKELDEACKNMVKSLRELQDQLRLYTFG